GPLQELTGPAEPLELQVVDEVVVHPVDLAGAGWARGHRDREPDLRVVTADVCRHGALADGGRPGEDDKAGACWRDPVARVPRALRGARQGRISPGRSARGASGSGWHPAHGPDGSRRCRPPP